ncbi:rad26-like snf2 family dna-dependent atpase [Moniliophthora roreri]|uniref:Putative RAD26-like SNF2 family DNA-dependent ATPase n=1 Tax=Moniliophthora roreri TaxID=221103 RepID=A0A0W0G1P0_MONRR|nr:rad26-like snf2 family dna-dependent atpase [Moniliophthora roreri]
MAQDKSSVYDKRKATSIPAPLEPESDSDFNPGAYEYETKPKKQRELRTRKSKSTGARSSEGRKRRRKSDEPDEEVPVQKQIRRVWRKASDVGPNPLAEFFGHELDLHSASEAEAEAESDVADDEGSAAESNCDEEMEEPIVLKTMQGFIHNASRKTSPPIQMKPPENSTKKPETNSEDPSAPHSSENTAVDDSETEDEDMFCEVPETKPATSDSETDDDFDVTPSLKVVEAPRSGPASDSQSHSDSETEDEYDVVMKPPDVREDPQPRPGFPLSSSQTELGPLVLNAEQDVEVPGAINTYLREYQREGIRFFWDRFHEKRGGLLGDDMGLGKTIQVISFLSAIMSKTGTITDENRRYNHVSQLQDGESWKMHRKLPAPDATWPTCLVIAPSSVVLNWEREFQTWGYFEVGVYIGSDRKGVLKDFKLGRLDVVLTSFDIARRDIELLDDLSWSCIFIDEVHRLKNDKSKLAKAYGRFQCTQRFGLTGTAIQNSYDEFWTILDWTSPGRLGTRKEWQYYVTKPLQRGQSASADDEERVKALEVARILKERLLPRFFLRRTKDIIKDQLPKKFDQVVFCPLAEMQTYVYKKVLACPTVQDILHNTGPCRCGEDKKYRACCFKSDLFRFLSLLIKVSNHIVLALPSDQHTQEQRDRIHEVLNEVFPEGNPLKAGEIELVPQYCGKWLALQALLKEWKKDPTNKVLIFTKSKRLLVMLGYYLKLSNYKSLSLSGDTKLQDRMPLIDQFHSDPETFIFLITTMAGGVGLNLTGANKVVIFDPNWNPAHDLQAMDRAFRFGQRRDVHVYRLLGAGALEELIYARQLYKQQQMAIGYDASIQTRYFKGVQGDKKNKGELFGVTNIFKLHEGPLATQMAIEKANVAQLDWALANMNSKTRRLSTEGRQFIEAESKFKDDEITGLGSLLFSDDLPTSTAEQHENDIENLLSSIGISYSHRNDEVLVSSRIEEERVKNMIDKVRRKKAARRSERSSSKPVKARVKTEEIPPAPQWPPIRKHHKLKPKLAPEEILCSRLDALKALDMIKSDGELPQFAERFARQTIEEQRTVLKSLDEFIRENKIERS